MEHMELTELTGQTEQIELGDVTVTRVKEYYGPVGMTPGAFIPTSREDAWRDNDAWHAPDFLDPRTNIVNAAVQSWLLRSEGKTILVDTGAGNDKERPYSPVWSHLRTDFLATLGRAGVAPEDVDIVINTHLHVDHVGWNTCLDGRDWVPTFPNATYLLPKDDFDFWNPDNGHKPLLGRGNQNVFEDSVAPVHRAGQVHLWEGSHRIDDNLRLDTAPGHTPGSSVLTLVSGTDRAVFVGDLLHSPVQLVDPEHNSCFCEDPVGARATRRRILGWAADRNALVVPAHLGGHGAAEVERSGDAFAIKGWAPFTPYVRAEEDEAQVTNA
ncbi:MBL fold metallo-hydrolase [Streptomyces sp. NPDC056486]|uniref:MBL fold metallo-hydrolase n=1 Tax=Streptomyces sp. NPDC056486 TaxID=3345835 RepID=UPI0036D0D701